MAGAGLRIEVRVDDREIRHALRRLRGRLTHMRPVMDEIGQRMVTSTLHRFEVEAGPGGKPWQRSGRARREGGQTLTRTGRLRGSLTHSADDDSVEWGTNVEYAAIHQFGGRTPARVIRPRYARALRFRGPGGRIVFARSVRHPGSLIPARPFLGLDDDDRRAVVATISRALRRAVSGGGGAVA